MSYTRHKHGIRMFIGQMTYKCVEVYYYYFLVKLKKFKLKKNNFNRHVWIEAGAAVICIGIVCVTVYGTVRLVMTFRGSVNVPDAEDATARDVEEGAGARPRRWGRGRALGGKRGRRAAVRKPKAVDMVTDLIMLEPVCSVVWQSPPNIEKGRPVQ